MPEPAFSGVYAATPTPLVPDGSGIDPAAIDRLTEYLVTSGVHGLVVGGSTGEFTALDLDERKLVTEAFLAATDGRLPVVAGTGALTTVETVELSVHAAKAGAGAVMVAPPYYERPSSDELVEHLRAVVESVDVPTIYYHMPSLTGVELDADGLADLLRRSGATAVKDSGGDFTVFTALQQHPEVGTRCSTGGTASRWRRSPAAPPPRSGAWRASSPAGAPSSTTRSRSAATWRRPARCGTGCSRSAGSSTRSTTSRPSRPGSIWWTCRWAHPAGRCGSSPRTTAPDSASSCARRASRSQNAARHRRRSGVMRVSVAARADPDWRPGSCPPRATSSTDARVRAPRDARSTWWTPVGARASRRSRRGRRPTSTVPSPPRCDAQPAWAARVPKERSEVLLRRRVAGRRARRGRWRSWRRRTPASR